MLLQKMNIRNEKIGWLLNEGFFQHRKSMLYFLDVSSRGETISFIHQVFIWCWRHVSGVIQQVTRQWGEMGSADKEKGCLSSNLAPACSKALHPAFAGRKQVNWLKT